MIQIRINGEAATMPIERLQTFADLIELVKSSIDPEHMVTLIHLDGRDISDEEWMLSPQQLPGELLDFQTGRPEIYVAERLQDASGVVRSCFFEFRDARKGFQDGDAMMGNKRLKVAVDTLRAFFEWYGTLMQLVPDTKRAKLDISNEVQEISEICKKICQQQLYQSWWALGESLEKDLEPKLDKLEDACRKVAREAQGNVGA
ncbi:MAG: hypothetical protein NTV65_05000 [Proteobacteria bacterium]|jgi:hypothetical protein|nr:hypothetical protein [Pseudomonadota bacterium]